MSEALENTSFTLPTEELHALVAVARRWADHGRTEDAHAMLAGLVDLEPERSFLRTSLGCLYMKLGRDPEALGAFEDALALDPHDVVALTHAGELRLERGDREGGMSLLLAAAESNSGGRDPHTQRALTLRALAAVEER